MTTSAKYSAYAKGHREFEPIKTLCDLDKCRATAYDYVEFFPDAEVYIYRENFVHDTSAPVLGVVCKIGEKIVWCRIYQKKYWPHVFDLHRNGTYGKRLDLEYKLPKTKPKFKRRYLD